MFPQLLKSLRKEKNVTQIQLAEAIGVSAGNVGDWENGKSRPSYSALIALSQFFQVSADTLLEIDTQESRPGAQTLQSVKRQQGLSCEASPLQEREADLVAMMRMMDERDWADILDLVSAKYARACKEKAVP